MNGRADPTRRARRLRGLALAAWLLAGQTGCYYTHLAHGQLALLWAREPVEELLADDATPDALRHRLALSQSVRSFARELGLEVDGQYTSYVPWEGDRLVTTLVRARPGEVEPTPFRFPLVGALPYKGYFDREAALAEAARLREEGFDVCVSPVVAYSTLGWVDDPLTGPMLRRARGDDELVETLIHELVHANGFWPEDTDFSESVASFIGGEGAVRFYEARGDEAEARRARARVDDDRRIAAVVLALRSEVEALYARSAAADASAARAALEAEARRRLAGLDLAVRSAERVAESARLSDACLAIHGTYAADLPLHASLFAARGGDLRAFVERLRSLAEVDAPRAPWFERP
ncbi:MAG: aminopeptidase [Myxococcota bacterium]